MRLWVWVIFLMLLMSGYASACSNPMGKSQLQKVTQEFERMTPGGDGFKIDKCRNITIVYGKEVRKGKLHELFTTLNHSHHDTTYYGLINKGEWWVSSSGGGVYLYHPDKTKRQSADWMVRMNEDTVRLLKLAGYKNDPQASKRAEILKRDLEELGTPDFGEAIGGLLSIMKNAPSGSSNAQTSDMQSKRKYQCSVTCSDLSKNFGSQDTRIQFGITAPSATSAYNYVNQKYNSICQKRGLKPKLAGNTQCD